MTSREELIERRERVREFYNFLNSHTLENGDSNGLVTRTLIISELEKLTNTSFVIPKREKDRSPTRYYKRKVDDWLEQVERELAVYKGEDVRRYRERNRLSHEQLSKTLRISVDYLKKIERDGAPANRIMLSLLLNEKNLKKNEKNT